MFENQWCRGHTDSPIWLPCYTDGSPHPALLFSWLFFYCSLLLWEFLKFVFLVWSTWHLSTCMHIDETLQFFVVKHWKKKKTHTENTACSHTVKTLTAQNNLDVKICMTALWFFMCSILLMRHVCLVKHRTQKRTYVQLHYNFWKGGKWTCTSVNHYTKRILMYSYIKLHQDCCLLLFSELYQSAITLYLIDPGNKK